MYNVIFESEVKGLLRINGRESCDLSCGRERVRAGECFSLEFIPYGDKFIPICERVNLTGSGTDRVRLLHWDKCVTSAFLCPKKRVDVVPAVAVCQAVCGKHVVTLCDDGRLFLLSESGEKMAVFPIDFDGRRAEFSSYNGYLRLDIEGEFERFLGLYEVGADLRVVYEGIGGEFAFGRDGFKKLRTYDTMSHCTVERTYSLVGGVFTETETRLIETDCSYGDGTPVELKICAFFEGVRLGVAQLCVPLLSAELGRSFSIRGASEFFGAFTDVLKSPIIPGGNVAALVYRGESDINCRHFCFEIERGLICNITEIERD